MDGIVTRVATLIRPVRFVSGMDRSKGNLNTVNSSRQIEKSVMMQISVALRANILKQIADVSCLTVVFRIQCSIFRLKLNSRDCFRCLFVLLSILPPHSLSGSSFAFPMDRKSVWRISSINVTHEFVRRRLFVFSVLPSRQK